jgi:hypothetical protein
MFPEFHEPSSPADVWASESLLTHVIVSPTPMAIGFGAYAVFVNTDAFLTMDTGVPVAPVPPDGVDGEYELHPMLTPINPATMPSRNVIFFSIRLRHIAKALPFQAYGRRRDLRTKPQQQRFLWLRKVKCFQVT